MAQDTNSRASLTYDAYRQFVDPIQATPLDTSGVEAGLARKQQQQQFDTQRKDALIEDLGEVTKHDLVPVFASGVNEAIRDLRNDYLNGDLSIEETKRQLLNIQQSISEFKSVSDGFKEVLKEPNKYVYNNPETGKFETGLDAVTRVVYNTKGYGDAPMYEKLESAVEMYSGIQEAPENTRELIGRLGDTFFEAKAKESFPEITDRLTSRGREVSLVSISDELNPNERDRFIRTLANSPEIKRSLFVEYNTEGNALSEQYDSYEDYAYDVISDFVPESKSETKVSLGATPTETEDVEEGFSYSSPTTSFDVNDLLVGKDFYKERIKSLESRLSKNQKGEVENTPENNDIKSQIQDIKESKKTYESIVENITDEDYSFLPFTSSKPIEIARQNMVLEGFYKDKESGDYYAYGLLPVSVGQKDDKRMSYKARKPMIVKMSNSDIESFNTRAFKSGSNKTLQGLFSDESEEVAVNPFDED